MSYYDSNRSPVASDYRSNKPPAASDYRSNEPPAASDYTSNKPPAASDYTSDSPPAASDYQRQFKNTKSAGPDIDVWGAGYVNTVQAASTPGDEKVVQTLLDAGAEINAQGGEYGNARRAAPRRIPHSEPSMSWDLIEHFKLDAQIHGDHTLHTEYESNPARGTRKARVEKRWYKERHIGHGAFGDVWLEVQKERDQVTAKRAVKSIQKRRIESVKIDYKRELLALAKLSRHQELFVVLYGWYENNDSVFLAMEYFPYGDLEDYITRGITEDGAKLICAQLVEGLSLMHSIGFTHRDLKPQNIFVVSTEPQWWVKIGDFGISKRTATEQTALRTQAGTQQFQAPEILGFVEEAEETSEYTNAVDMWSLGCVTYLILAQTIPFARPRALNEYCSGKVQFPSKKLRARDVSMDGLRFVEELLNPYPSQRLAAEPASQHTWLQLSVPAEVKNGKVQGHRYQVQDSGPLRQTRSTEQILGAEMHVGALEQEQLQHQPEHRASSERAMSADDTSSISLTSLQKSLPVTVQGEQAVGFPTKTSTAPPSAIRPSPLPQSTRKVSTTDSVTEVPASWNSTSDSISPQPDSTNTLRPNRSGDHHQSTYSAVSVPAEASDEEDPGLTKCVSPSDRWARIRKNAADRAARQSEEQTNRSRTETRTDDGETSGEETIASRVARIKARVAELTGNMEQTRR